MSANFHERRAIRAYTEAHRDAIHATEREAITREPEPCNFCAPDDLVPATTWFGELRQFLGRWWLLWLIAFSGLCVTSLFLAGALIYLSVHP